MTSSLFIHSHPSLSLSLTPQHVGRGRADSADAIQRQQISPAESFAQTSTEEIQRDHVHAQMREIEMTKSARQHRVVSPSRQGFFRNREILSHEARIIRRRPSVIHHPVQTDQRPQRALSLVRNPVSVSRPERAAVPRRRRSVLSSSPDVRGARARGRRRRVPRHRPRVAPRARDRARRRRRRRRRTRARRGRRPARRSSLHRARARERCPRGR